MKYTNVIGAVISSGSSEYEVITSKDNRGAFGLQDIHDKSANYHTSGYTLDYFNEKIRGGQWKIIREPEEVLLYDIY